MQKEVGHPWWRPERHRSSTQYIRTVTYIQRAIDRALDCQRFTESGDRGKFVGPLRYLDQTQEQALHAANVETMRMATHWIGGQSWGY
jgi:uncharacterized protein (DUF2252 family)